MMEEIDDQLYFGDGGHIDTLLCLQISSNGSTTISTTNLVASIF